MADDAVFYPADDGLSPNSGIEITVEECSENSEELLDDDREAEFGIETNYLSNRDNQMLLVKSGDLENSVQQVLGIDSESNGEQVLGILRVGLEQGSQRDLEFSSNGHESSGEEMLEILSSSDQMHGISVEDNEITTAYADAEVMGKVADDIQGKSCLSPAVGMEFESYDDAYNYYNGYAKELGFGIRVKSSWTKRNSKEKRGAVLCCNCEGFKTMKEASTRRKETRTGCLAMIRLRLVENDRWRLDEVKLEHNHLFDHQRAQTSRSHKKMAVIKRKLEPVVDVEVQTIKLYRSSTVNSVSYGSSVEQEASGHVELSKRMKFRDGGVSALYNYFRQAQLSDPSFFYVMDLNDEGYVRNVFWIDSRSRAAYRYFGDIVILDTKLLSNKHDIPLCSFSGLNHHGEPVLLGCGFLVDESLEAYLWLIRAWLTCMSGRPPQTIITQQCQVLRVAISEVLPRAHHRLCLRSIMRHICATLGEVGESEVFQTILIRTVYKSMKIEEFEMAWEQMIEHFCLRDQEWLQSLYEDRERWVPVYLKDTIFNGVFSFQPGKHTTPFFHGYLHNQMTFSEFFHVYDSLQQKRIYQEALDDLESRQFRPVLRVRLSYESQASEMYTKEVFQKFQEEVVLMSTCYGITQIHASGTIVTYMVKEHNDVDGSTSEAKNFEVVYEKQGSDVRCLCSCFNFNGYLCRHALSILHYNDVEEIPGQYILQRWRKDVQRHYIPNVISNSIIDSSNPIQRHEHLHLHAMQVVAEGMASQEHRRVAWQELKKSLNKVHLAAGKTI